MPVSFVFAFAGRQAGIKGRNKKCLLVLCLCTVIEIRRRNKKLGLGLCTVVYIGLGKTSVTSWTISSLENWGNHLVEWTILRSFRATWVTLPDCIGGVTWQHIIPYQPLIIYWSLPNSVDYCSTSPNIEWEGANCCIWPIYAIFHLL